MTPGLQGSGVGCSPPSLARRTSPMRGLRGEATDCDHILALSLGGSFVGPVQSLRRRCHLRKTAEDSKGAKRNAARRRNR